MSIVFPATRSAVKVTGSNQATSNAASWYLNDLNILTVANNTSSNKIFYYDKGNIVISTGTNTVKLYNTATFYTTETNIIAIDDFSFSITQPSNFLSTGSSIIALLPTGTRNIDNISGVNSNFVVESSKFKSNKVVQASSSSNLLIYSKGIKIDLTQAQALSTIAYSRSLTKHVEPSISFSRSITFTTSSQTVFLSYPIKITASNLEKNSDYRWYLNDGLTFPITRSTSNNVVYSFINPVHPFQLGFFTKAKLFTPAYEKVVDIITNTNNSITISYLPEFPSIGEMSVFLGNINNFTSSTIGNNNSVQRLERIRYTPFIEALNTITNSVIEISAIKISSDAVRFIPEKLNRFLDIIKEPFVVNGRTRVLTSSTSLLFSNPIKITGRSGISSDFTTNYVYENQIINFTYSTGSQVTLFFNNTNNNLSYGPITTARLITPSGDLAVNVISYTIDSITINDIFGFLLKNNFNTINDLFIRLGYTTASAVSTLTNSSLIAQIDKFKSFLDGTIPRLSTSMVNKSAMKISGNTVRLAVDKLKALTKIDEPFIPRTINGKILQKEYFKEPITQPQKVVSYSTSSSILYTPPLRVTGTGKLISNFFDTYLFDNLIFGQLEIAPPVVRIFFTPYNNNLLIGNIISVIITTPFYSWTQEVYEYDIDSVSIIDYQQLFNYYEGGYISGMTVRLGIEIINTQATFNNTNQIPLINKTSYDTFRSIDDRIKIDGFKGLSIPLKAESSKIFSAKIQKFTKESLSEPFATALRPVTFSTANVSLFYDLLPVIGKTGITTNFVNYYTFEENKITKTITTSALVTLYFTNKNNNYNYGDVNKVRLFAPNFDIILNVTSVTNESVTIADVLNFNSKDINTTYDIGQLQISLGKDIIVTTSLIGDASRVPIVNRLKTSAITINETFSNVLNFRQLLKFKSDNIKFSDTAGFYKLKENQYITFETPKSSFVKSTSVLRDINSYIPTPIVIPSTTSLIFGSVIDIGGISRTTSTFVNYYYNELNTFKTFSTSGSTVLYFSATIVPNQQTQARLLGYRTIDNVESLYYDEILPILNLNSQSVTLPYFAGDYKFRIQLGKILTSSGGTFQTYPLSQFRVNNLNQQKFSTSDPIGIELVKTGKLNAALKLAATTSTLSVSRYKNEIVIKGEGRIIPQRNTIVSTSSNIIFESYIYNIYGKNATTSTAVSWYLNENYILSTIPRGTNLVTLYFGSLPQYNFPSGNFIRLIAPYGGYDLVHPIVSLTNDSVTIIDNQGIPEVTGMFAYIGTLRTTFTYAYSDPNSVPQLSKQKFQNFDNGSLKNITVSKLNQVATKLVISSNVEKEGYLKPISPRLFDSLKWIGKSVITITSSTNLIFDPTPIPVYGLNLTTSTFVGYYLNEYNILTTIPLGSNIVTAYLGNNPPYLQVTGSVIRFINSNSGFIGQFNVISSTYDSVTFLSVGTLPSVSGLVLYSGSIQTTFDRILSDTNNVGKITKDYLARNFNEITKDGYGIIKQSLFAKGLAANVNDAYVNKKFISVKSTIEIPKTDKFSLIPKIADTLNWQSNSFSITTGTSIEFYPSISAPGRIQSTSTFVNYYELETTNFITFDSTSNIKTFFFNNFITLDPGFSHLKLIAYNLYGTTESTIFEYVAPITAINSNSISFIYVGPIPSANYKISIGKTFTTFTRTFTKTSNIGVIEYYTTELVLNATIPSISYLNKPFTVVKDFLPLPATGNVRQYKLPILAGDRTYVNSLIYNISLQLFYREPIIISGRSLSTSTFVNYYTNEFNQIQTFLTTSNYLTLYFDRTTPIIDEYTVAKITGPNFEFSTTVVTVTSSSLTIDKPAFFEIPSGQLLVYLGRERIIEIPAITRDSALQITNLSKFKISNNAATSFLKLPRELDIVGKLKSSAIVRGDAAANKINADKVKVVTSLRSEKNAEPHRTTTVSTSSKIIFDNIIYTPYASNLTTSTEVTNYLYDGITLNTYDINTNTIVLYFGNLPLFYQSFNTFVRVINENNGYDQITPLINYTKDSITINRLKDFPSISGLKIYFGEFRILENIIVSDTNQVQKIDWKWRNFHTFASITKGDINKPITNLREIIDRSSTSFLQKPIVKLQSLIEVPKNDKAQSILVLKDVSKYKSRIGTQTSSTGLVYYGPYDATGKVASTSNFLTQYIYDYDKISSYYYSGTIATLFASPTIPLNQNFVTARIIGYPTLGSLPILDLAFTITNLTTNTVSFNFPSRLPDYRYQIYFGKEFLSSITNLSDEGNVEQINSAKFKQGITSIEISKSGQLEKSAIKLRDLQNNINLGLTKSVSRLYGDRSYQAPITITTGASILEYPEAVIISASSKSTSTFVRYYIDENLTFKTYVNTSALITLYFNRNISSTATYTLARFNGINYEFSTSFVDLTTNSITIVDPVNSFPLPEVNGSLSMNLGRFSQVQTSTSIARDAALQLPNITNYKIPALGIGSQFVVPPAPSLVGKLKSSNIVIGDINRFTKNDIKFVTKLYSEKSSTSTRATIVTTSSVIIFDPISYKVYGTNQITSNAATYYAYEQNFLTTTTNTGSTITLLLGALPLALQVHSTHVKIINETGYDQQFIIQSFTQDSITINKPKDFPEISTILLYFGTSRIIENISYSDTSYLAKFNFKFGNFYSSGNPILSQLNRSVTSLKADLASTLPSFLQKGFIPLRSVVEVPKVDKPVTITSLKESTSYISRTKITTTSNFVIYDGPYDANGTNANTSTFVNYYVNELNLISVYQYTGTTATLYLSNAIRLPQQYSSVRVQAYQGLSDSAFFDGFYPITSITTNTVSFEFVTLPQARFKVFLGKFITSSSVTLSGGNNVSLIDKTKISSVNTIEVPRISQIQKPITIIKDLQNNIQTGKASSANKLVADRTFSQSSIVINHSPTVVYSQAVEISGVDRATSNFVNQYVFDEPFLQTFGSPTTGKNLFFARPIENFGNPTTIRVVRYGSSFYLAGVFYPSAFYFDKIFNILAITSDYVFIDDPDNSLPVGALAVYLGYDYQQPSSVQTFNTSSLAVSLVNYFKVQPTQTVFSLATFSNRLTLSQKAIGIEIPVQSGKVKSINKYIGDTNKFPVPKLVSTSSYVLKQPIVFSTATMRIENTYSQILVSTNTAPTTPREMLYYVGLAPAKYGRSITVYPKDLVSPVNIIPAKTRTVTTGSGLVWAQQSFKVYGTNLTTQTNINWYTLDNNFYSYNTNTTSSLVLYFGALPAFYSALYFNNSHIRLINNQGYDQVFSILTSTVDTVTIADPISLPSVNTLKAYFGSTSTVETLTWNDQGIVPTFITALNTTYNLQRLIFLVSPGIIVPPNRFTIAEKIRETSDLLTRPLPKIDQAFTASVTSYIPVNLRPTSAREIMAVLFVAPGLRLNRSISQGMLFSDFGNNFTAQRIKSSISVKAPASVENVLKIDAVNTQSSFVSGDTSTRALIYYTNLAPGYRKGIYYNTRNAEFFETNRNVTAQDVVPKIPYTFTQVPIQVKSIQIDTIGQIQKPIIALKLVPIILDTKSVLNKSIVSLRAAITSSEINLVGKPIIIQSMKGEVTSLNYFQIRNLDINVVSIQDESFFDINKYFALRKIIGDQNRFLATEQFKLPNYVKEVGTNLKIDNLEKFLIKPDRLQFFDTPNFSLFDETAGLKLKPIEIDLRVGETNFVSKIGQTDKTSNSFIFNNTIKFDAVSLSFQPLGQINKPSIIVKHIPINLENVNYLEKRFISIKAPFALSESTLFAGIKIIPLIKEDFIPIRPYFLDRAKALAFTVDDKLSQVNKLLIAQKLKAEPNIFSAVDQFKLQNNLRPIEISFNTDLVDKLKVPKANTQVFYSPGLTYLDDQTFKLQLEYDEPNFDFGKTVFTEKFISGPKFYSPVDAINFARHYNFQTFSIDRVSALKNIRKLGGIFVPLGTDQVNRPMTKLAFDEDRLLIYKEKLGNLQKGEFRSLYVAENIGYLLDKARFDELRSLIFKTDTGKIQPYTAIRAVVDLEEKPLGIFSRIDKVGIVVINFDDTGSVKYSQDSINEAINSKFIAENGYLIKFKQPQSAALQDPSTRRIPPIQFWN